MYAAWCRGHAVQACWSRAGPLRANIAYIFAVRRHLMFSYPGSESFHSEDKSSERSGGRRRQGRRRGGSGEPTGARATQLAAPSGGSASNYPLRGIRLRANRGAGVRQRDGAVRDELQGVPGRLLEERHDLLVVEARGRHLPQARQAEERHLEVEPFRVRS